MNHFLPSPKSIEKIIDFTSRFTGFVRPLMSLDLSFDVSHCNWGVWTRSPRFTPESVGDNRRQQRCSGSTVLGAKNTAFLQGLWCGNVSGIVVIFYCCLSAGTLHWCPRACVCMCERACVRVCVCVTFLLQTRNFQIRVPDSKLSAGVNVRVNV